MSRRRDDGSSDSRNDSTRRPTGRDARRSVTRRPAGREGRKGLRSSSRVDTSSSTRVRRPAGRNASDRTRAAQQARLRAERPREPRRVDATMTPDAHALQSRASAVMVLFLLAWAVVAVRAGQLAVVPDERLTQRLGAQQERVITVAPQRGSIVDRLGRPLAISVELFSVFADPSMVEAPEEAAELLASVLDLDKAELLATLSRDDTRFAWLARQLPSHVADKVREYDVPGVVLTAEAHRDYPSGPLAGPLLGFVGVDGNGLEGLEARFDHVLKGDSWQYRVLRDGRRRVVNHDALLSRRSTEGNTLVLTLDHSIQHVAERELAAAVERHDAVGGQAVVMDAQTGAILALASAPAFDPNNFRGVDRSRFRQRAVTDVYEPGSTMKPFVVAEALEQKRVKPSDTIFCERGRWKVGRRIVHDTHEYEDLTIGDIIKLSSNIGTAKIGELLGAAKVEAAYRRFGFGDKTGIEMYGEERGILRPSESWSRIGFATHCFGQGMAVTGLQLTNAFAGLVNGGKQLEPHLVAEVRDTQGEVVEDRRKGPTGVQLISPATSRTLRSMMHGVVQPDGTGPKAAMSEYTAGGKTGTAQKVKDGRYGKGLYVSSFIGFAPVTEPRVVTLVVLDEPKNKYYGGTVAGPAFSEITSHALRELGVPPDKQPEGGVMARVVSQQAEEAEAERAEAEDNDGDKGSGDGVALAERTLEQVISFEGEESTWLMPDLSGLSARRALRLLAPSGADVALAGSGLVKTQTPAVGEELVAGAPVQLELTLADASRRSRR